MPSNLRLKLNSTNNTTALQYVYMFFILFYVYIVLFCLVERDVFLPLCLRQRAVEMTAVVIYYCP